MTEQIQIVVKFFAMLRDRIACSQLTIQLSPSSRISDAVAYLSQMYPGLDRMLCGVAYAVNENYVPDSTELHDGDELALIPPVSGG